MRAHARRHGWALTEIDAGEFSDPRYLRNPLNRCYFCKSNLYDRIAGLTDRSIASGANLDDLGDVRPRASGGGGTAGDLQFVNEMEEALSRLAPRLQTLRCRILKTGVGIEIDNLSDPALPQIRALAAARAAAAGRRFAGVSRDRRGAAFVSPSAP